MRVFKKISILLSLAVVPFISFFGIVAAESFLPLVTVEDVRVDKRYYDGGDIIVGSFVMANRSDQVVDGLSYAVSVSKRQEGSQDEALFGTQKFDERMIFAPGELKTISYSYKSPEYVDGSNYTVRIDAYLNSSIPLGNGESRKVSFVGKAGSLSFNKYYLVTNEGFPYPLESGPTITAGEKESEVYLSFSLKNDTKEAVKIIPKISIFNQFKQDTVLKEFSLPEQIVDAQTSSDIEQITLPTFQYTPGVYTGVVDFVDSQGVQRAQSLPFRYIVGGDIATIHTFVSKQQKVEVGEPIDVSLTYTGSPIDIARQQRDPSYKVASSSFDVDIKIFNEKDVLVASYATSTVVLNQSTLDVSLVAGVDARALSGVAVISKNGKQLFEKKVIFSTNYKEARAHSAATKPVILYSALCIVCIGLLFLFKKNQSIRRKIGVIVLLVVVLSLIALALLKPYKVDGERLISTLNLESYPYTFQMTSPYNGQVFDTDTAYRVAGNSSYTACYNADSNITHIGTVYQPTMSSQTKVGTLQSANTCVKQKRCTKKNSKGVCIGDTVWYWNCNFGTYHEYYPISDSASFVFTSGSEERSDNEARFTSIFSNMALSATIQERIYFTTEKFGKCSSVDGTIAENMPSGLDACSFGTQANAIITPISKNRSTADWECVNANNRKNLCSVDLAARCGTAHGRNLSSAPRTELCELNRGTPSSVTTTATGFTWKCTGTGVGNIKSCSAYKATTCGTADSETPVKVAPKINLCTVGTASAVLPNGANDSYEMYEWSCTNTGTSNVSYCSVPGISTCGTLGDTGTDKIVNGGKILPTSVGLCAAENNLSGNISVNYNTGLWTWACKNWASKTVDTCSASCTAGTYYCKNTNTCQTTCSDWCPDSVSGNPTGGQTLRKSFINMDENGSCSISQIDKFYIRPTIADNNNTCKAYWNIKAKTNDRTVTCYLNDTLVSCSTTLSSGVSVQPGQHVFKVKIDIDQSTPLDGRADYSMYDTQIAKCTPSPAHKEI